MPARNTRPEPLWTPNKKKLGGPSPLALLNYNPPQALESEVAILSAMLIYTGECERWAQHLSPDDFYRPHHAAIFRVLQDMATRRVPLDIITMMAEAQASGTMDACGGREYVAHTLTSSDPYQGHTSAYARHIKEAAHKRTLADGALAVLEAAAGGATVEEVGAAANRMVQNAPRTEDVHTMKATRLLQALTDRMEEAATDPRDLLGLSTGLSCLDRMTNGFQSPDLIVLGARPGVGKSALMSAIAAHVAIKRVPVFIASMEMSGEQVVKRMVGAEARLDSRRMLSGRLTQAEWNRFTTAAYPLYAAPLVVNDRSAVTPDYLRAELRKFLREFGSLGLVCVDYLQLMRSDRKTSGRYEELSDVSMELKSVAREFDVPLLALTQISRESTKRDNKRPVLSDIRDTGQIEQDADVVMFLHRPDQLTAEGSGYAPADPDALPREREIELIFAKQRNGPQGVVHLSFVDQFAAFFDPADAPASPAPLPTPPSRYTRPAQGSAGHTGQRHAAGGQGAGKASDKRGKNAAGDYALPPNYDSSPNYDLPSGEDD